MRKFSNIVTFDWSGANQERPSGLAMAHTASDYDAPTLMQPGKGWSRLSVRDWLLDHAKAETDMIIAFDLSPALPFSDRGAYFDGLSDTPPDARALWALVDQTCDSDPYLAANSFLSDDRFRPYFRVQNYDRDAKKWTVETGARFGIGAGRMRVVERQCTAQGLGNSASCLNAVGAAQVAKSSLTGMRLLHQLGGAIPVWPFDPAPARGPLIIEIYTTIAARAAGIGAGRSKIRDGDSLDIALANLDTRAHKPLAAYTDHATDAILTTAWLREAVKKPENWQPEQLTTEIARTEGWTFGVA
ncbi:MAG: hypothetical protein WA979_05380 [Pacificimonas sp.]